MKKIKIISLLIIICSVSFMLYSIIAKINQASEKEEKLVKMPEFSFTFLSGKEFSYSDLNQSKYTLFIYFSTTCIYCEKQIEYIIEKYEFLKNIQIIMITDDQKDSVNIFLNKYKLKKYEPDILVVLSDSHKFDKMFGHWNTPSLFLYDNNKQLVFINQGVLPVDSIISHF